MMDGLVEFIPAFLMSYSNSDFTNPHEVVLPDVPEGRQGTFSHMGVKYWGFETSRHRATEINPEDACLEYDSDAYNWFIMGFEGRSKIEKISISTKWFTGNQVQEVSLYLIDRDSGNETMVIERARLEPDAEQEFLIDNIWATECLVRCYQEGGIARINCYGQIDKDNGQPLVNLLEKAKITHISNEHYGCVADAVRACRKEMHMAGWETARTGFGERALFHLEKPSYIEEIIVDTYMYRLNAPLCCYVFGFCLDDENEQDIDRLMESAPAYKLVFSDGVEVVPQDFCEYMSGKKYQEEEAFAAGKKFRIAIHNKDGGTWKVLLPFTALRPDTFHRFNDFDYDGKITHLLYMHYPNGGIHALRALGRI
jgi:allantoicase